MTFPAALWEIQFQLMFIKPGQSFDNRAWRKSLVYKRSFTESGWLHKNTNATLESPFSIKSISFIWREVQMNE